ncbi:phosphatase PAP2 family protein [Kribbella sp. NPDC006257]|uniref:phosphatase PAP2 family protein n=1 Tax=Kribbella sp. NPDC006257 TaxID=3156738 RepID=UPI0033A0CE95
MAETIRYAVPLAGAVVAVTGTLGVIALADSATESDGLAALDPQLTTDVLGVRTAPLTAVARALTFAADVPVLSVLILLVAVLLWRRTRAWRAPGLLLIAMTGSAALTYGLKLIVERHRPGILYVLGPVDTSYAFPSGHTLNSAVFFGVLAMLTCAGLRSRRARIGVVAIAVLFSLGIGASRWYLGYHWATDVLAGWLIAISWLAVVGTGAWVFRRSALWGG